jgi:hypothetical protein
MIGGDGMDSTIEYMMSDVRRLMWPCSIAAVAVVIFRGCEALRAWIFGRELIAWVLVLPSFTWSILFSPGYVYLMLEPSWYLGMYPWPSYYVSQ